MPNTADQQPLSISVEDVTWHCFLSVVDRHAQYLLFRFVVRSKRADQRLERIVTREAKPFKADVMIISRASSAGGIVALCNTSSGDRGATFRK